MVRRTLEHFVRAAPTGRFLSRFYTRAGGARTDVHYVGTGATDLGRARDVQRCYGVTMGRFGRVALAMSALTGLLTLVTAPATATTKVPILANSPAPCPWLQQARAHTKSPLALANEVLARMTLREKASYAVLVTRAPLGNTNLGVARLCLPPLTISDGPDGLANGLIGVTQWPAELGLAATFSTTLAHDYGVALGAETASKGLDAIQAPELNLTRVALSGRTFETFGEDPYLAGQLGAAEIRGIQSRGTLAVVKHLGAYTQETARLHLNQVVAPRTLNELYLAPFRQAVRQGNAASLMCAYGAINGVNTCGDPTLFNALRAWGFHGFVRSDFHAALNVVQSFNAGVDVVKPSSVPGLVNLVRRGVLAVSVLNRAVRDVLTVMFRFHLIASARHFSPTTPATSASHVALATSIAENSMVLLKNSDALLPLSPATDSIAVLGLDASVAPIVTGGGSSAVLAPYLSSPLSALRQSFPLTHVIYQRGSTNTPHLNRLSNVKYLRGTPRLNGRAIPAGSGQPGRTDPAVRFNPNITPAVSTATHPGHGAGWNHMTLHIETRHSGIYELAVRQYGDTWISLDGKNVLASPGIHSRNVLSTSVVLAAKRRYTIDVRWFAIRSHEPPTLGLLDVSRRIASAVRAAHQARVAIVFAGAYGAEGADRANLLLPGDQNALIAAVAKANPRTIVVLNTGGAVAMPWLRHVAAVVEAWYPGQVDGQASAALLDGSVSPAGRLPLTFPASLASTPSSTSASFPGVNGSVTFAEGLFIGYRWYQAHHVRPLFPFGYGLSYTTFTSSSLRVRVSAHVLRVHLSVANTGPRSGVDVVEIYVHDPSSLDEPLEQLRGVARVTLAPGQHRSISVALPISSLAIYRAGAWITPAGRYRVDVGSSSARLTLHAKVRLT
ncbi:MAG: hypothetical protein B7X07_00135 [Actinobacteria bacterium 21-64-8]|nr:MAG: hypothetical protein B7X07_00135 [Actinobacteria bacterium 21-64-8]